MYVLRAMIYHVSIVWGDVYWGHSLKSVPVVLSYTPNRPLQLEYTILGFPGFGIAGPVSQPPVFVIYPNPGFWIPYGAITGTDTVE